MPNWDRYCTACGFVGSYLDFAPTSADEPDKQRCERTSGCGATVAWDDDEDDDGERPSCDDCGESYNAQESGCDDHCPRCCRCARERGVTP